MHNLLRTTLRMNKWLERRFWWWFIPLALPGLVLGLVRFCCESSF